MVLLTYLLFSVSLPLELQHHKMLKDFSIGNLAAKTGEEENDPNMELNLMTVASIGKAGLLDELLKAKLDPDIGDSQGRTPLVCSFYLCLAKDIPILQQIQNGKNQEEMYEQFVFYSILVK